jgi:hypothetical protein
MFLSNDIFEFCVIPSFHSFLLLPFFARICKHVLLCCLSLDGEIVRKLAFIASFALSLLKIDAAGTLASLILFWGAYRTVFGSVPKGTFCGA